MPIVPVLLPLPLAQPFSYRAAEALVPGTLVRVPFGARELIGVVWDEAAEVGVNDTRLKNVLGALDVPPLPAPLRRFLAHAAAETVNPVGAILRLTLSVPAALEPVPPLLGYRRTGEAGEGGTAPERRVLHLLAENEPRPASELAKLAKTSAAVLKRMASVGRLKAVALSTEPEAVALDLDHGRLPLSEGQQAAADRLVELVRARTGTALLDGIPGSGKTEVYFEAVAETLRQGRRVLVLLPEIALSAQWLERFMRRFGGPPAVWHSGLTPAQRRRSWRQLALGRAPVVIGARSALFLPLPDIGLIVVDEEHDTSFKQEDGTIYHGRDLALARAQLEGAAAVLASATPALETALHAGAVPGGLPPTPGWQHVRLPERHGPAGMPRLELIDMRRARPPRGAWLAPPLRDALSRTLADGGQSLVFLNRRGYAPLTLCRGCGYRLRCPNCTAWLTTHRLRHRLMCHHCGWSMAEPDHCPSCGAVGTLAASGPGVERVAEEVAALLPTARLQIMTSDTVHTASAAEAVVAAMSAREIDVLIGTQMIAKGHHFPALTLVGVVDADLTLAGGDLRAAEKTFQLLYQVAGRSGRGEQVGSVLIQTHLPEHPVIQALARGDRDAFLAAELDERRETGLPPFGRLAALILAGTDAREVKEHARAIVRAAPAEDNVTILGPAPAPLALLRGRWRERLLVKAGPELDLPAWIARWLAPVRLPTRVDLHVDVDPVSFL